MNPILNKSYDGYPSLPPYTPKPEEGLIWYYNKKLGFGCWLFNNYKKPMMVPSSLEQSKIDIHNPRRYKSPVPLHEPILPHVYQGKIVWYVDETGFGEAMYFKHDSGKLKLFRIKDFI